MSKIRIVTVLGVAAVALAGALACDGGATPTPTPTHTVTTTRPTTPATSAPATTPTTRPTPSTPPIGLEQLNATQTARDYLDTQGFSRKGLIRQLSSPSEGYSVKVATAAVDSLHADWNKQAAQTAKEYLTAQSYSRSGLIRQLESSAEGFTHSQAVYGVKAVGL